MRSVKDGMLAAAYWNLDVLEPCLWGAPLVNYVQV